MTTRKRLAAIMLSNSFLLMATAHAHKADQQPTEASLAISASGTLQAYRSATPDGDSNRVSFSAVPDSVAAFTKTLMAPQITMNAAASRFVTDYLRKNNEALEKVEQRSEPVFRIMEPILQKYDLPVELKYLAVVESDLKRTAVSRVGAAGPWQLMPATARELGLKVSKKNDERKQYAKSTTAAAKYLRDLYREYGDWLLVIAAYNAGPGTINKAIRKAGSRNFWKLQAFLPAETRGHVKRFIGTHYYFEDCGSETTLTKAENTAHAKALARFEALQESKVEINKSTDLAETNEQNAVTKEQATETLLLTRQK